MKQNKLVYKNKKVMPRKMIKSQYKLPAYYILTIIPAIHSAGTF